VLIRNSLLTALAILAPCASGFALAGSVAMADSAPAVKPPAKGMHRYMVARTFPPGALAGLDSAAKKSVNACNSSFNVRWVYSYANADKTKTYCIYEGPNEKAIQDAATANKIPIDSIVEIPVVLSPK